MFGVTASIVAYIVVSLGVGKKISSPASFYNDTGNLFRATLSLACYNITLGTGLAYLVQQSTLSGYFVFLTPVAMAAGYYLFARYMESLDFHPTPETPNLYRLLSPRSGGISLLTRIYSFAIVITFAFVLGFELWLGSELIAASLFVEPSHAMKIGVAALVFLIVTVYTTIGGMRSSVETDLYQAALLLGFVVAVAALVQAVPAAEDGAFQVEKTSHFQGAVVTLLAIATALTTQFYSIVNANFGTTYSAVDQRRMFTRAGLWAAIFYCIVLCIFLAAPRDVTIQHIATMIGSGQAGIYGWLALLFAAGMVAISMSSLDNATVSTSKVIFENWLSERATHNMLRLRVIHFSLSIIMMTAAVALIVLELNLFYTILTILFAVSVFSPVLCSSIWLHCKGRASLLDRRFVVLVIVACTVGSWMVYGYLNLIGQNTAGSILHLAALAIALAFSFVDIRHNREMPT